MVIRQKVIRQTYNLWVWQVIRQRRLDLKSAMWYNKRVEGEGYSPNSKRYSMVWLYHTYNLMVIEAELRCKLRCASYALHEQATHALIGYTYNV